MVIFILYYLPMIICILGAAYIIIKNEREWSTVFMSVIISCIPLVNIIFAAFLLDELDSL